MQALHYSEFSYFVNDSRGIGISEASCPASFEPHPLRMRDPSQTASYHDGTTDYPDPLGCWYSGWQSRWTDGPMNRAIATARDKRCCLQPYELWSSGSGIRPMVSSRAFRFRSQGISSPGLLHWPPDSYRY